MRLHHLSIAFLALPFGGAVYADDWQPDPGFRSLFNGKDLSGWVGHKNYWSVQDGIIVGKIGRAHV